MEAIKAPPSGWRNIGRQLGPGLIISATVVGSGELIIAPKLGATVGFTLLWFIILGCGLKVFVQVELGRYAITRGLTTLEAMDTVPGPRLVVSWLTWLWLFMYVALVFQVAGMIGGLADILGLVGLALAPQWIAVGLGVACATLLVIGHYEYVETVSMGMVGLFTCCTVLALAALQWTPYAVTPAQIVEGLSFKLPDSFTVAFAAFGVIGVGASELIYYPYWCLEKGYARHVGPYESTTTWRERANGWIRVMRIDAWVSLVVYTLATMAFYLLGAAVLHARGLDVSNDQMIDTLASMYQITLGTWSLGLFLLGAFVVFFSTVYVATASNARLLADGLSVFGLVTYPTSEARARMVRIGCVALPVLFTGVYLATGTPVTLVLVGAIAQGMMLPFLGLAAVYFRFRRTDRHLRPGLVWTVLLVLAALAMVCVGLYQIVVQISGVIG